MALNAQNQNIVTRIMGLGDEYLDLINRTAELIISFDENNVYNELLSEVIEDEFPHLDQSKVGNAIDTYRDLVTLFAENSNQDRIRLILLRG